MKRTPLRRKAPLRSGGKGLARSKPLGAGRPSPKANATEQTRLIVHLRAGGKCECGCGRPAVRAAPHHVFPKSRWPELADEPDNLIAAAAECHARHESAFRRFPRYAIRRAERLAATDAMKDYLDSKYEKRSLP